MNLPSILQRLANTLRFRGRWSRLGVNYGRSSQFDSSVVNAGGGPVELRWPAGEDQGQQEELGTILAEDCYGLEELPEPPKTILDLGGNCGLFSLVARAHFPDARIHLYEPNSELIPVIEHNLAGCGVEIYQEAISGTAGSCHVIDRGPSGAGTIEAGEDGDAVAVDLATAVERLGGRIDFAKMDCEGAEWGLFEDPTPWESISHFAMEYHLWAGDHKLVELVTKVHDLGFHIRSLNERQTAFNGLLWASHGAQGDFNRL